MSSTRTNVKNIKKELTALGQEDLSNEMEKVDNVKGEIDIQNSKQLMKDFDDMLDEVNEDFKFGTITYPTSRVLKDTDPVVYYEKLSNYVDNIISDEEAQSGEEMSEEEKEKLYDFMIEIDKHITNR